MKQFTFDADAESVAGFINRFHVECLALWSKKGHQSSLLLEGGAGFVDSGTPVTWPSEPNPDTSYAEARWRWEQVPVTIGADFSFSLRLKLTPPPGEDFQPQPGGTRYTGYCANVATLFLTEREPGRTETRLVLENNPLWWSTKARVEDIFVIQTMVVCEGFWRAWRHYWRMETLGAKKPQTKCKPYGLHGGTMDRVKEAHKLIEGGEHKSTACKRVGIDIRTYDRYAMDVVLPES